MKDKDKSFGKKFGFGKAQDLRIEFSDSCSDKDGLESNLSDP